MPALGYEELLIRVFVPWQICWVFHPMIIMCLSLGFGFGIVLRCLGILASGGFRIQVTGTYIRGLDSWLVLVLRQCICY